MGNIIKIIITSSTVAIIFTLLAKKMALKLSIVDHPGELKIHNEPIPYLGGLTVFLAILLLSNILKLEIPQIFWFLGGSLTVIGLFDDIKNLSSKLRFILESLVFIVYIVWQGTILPLNSIIDLFLIYLFFMGTVNSVNWMDGMDGVLSGVSIIVAIGFLWLSQNFYLPWVSKFLMIFIGVLIGFLLFNFPPAKIFLGDAGSYFIGFTFFYVSTVVLKYYYSPRTFFAILGLLSVFIIDSTTAFIRRIMNGVHPFQGDRNHMYDEIYKIVKNYRLTVVIMLIITICGVLVGIITFNINNKYWVVFWGFSAIVAYWGLLKLKFISLKIY